MDNDVDVPPMLEVVIRRNSSIYEARESTEIKKIGIDEAIEMCSTKLSYLHYTVFTLRGLYFAAASLDTNVLVFLSGCASETFSLNAVQQSSIFSVAIVGDFIGSLVWGQFAHVFGRRDAYLASARVMLLFGILSGFATSYSMLLGFRFMVKTMHEQSITIIILIITSLVYTF